MMEAMRSCLLNGFVVVFVSTTCPIANASMPAIARLGRTVREAGGELLLVHPDPLATAETVEKHRRDEREAKRKVKDFDADVAAALQRA